MGRLGLDKNRKFLRLARDLNAVSGGMGEALARGVLELLWDAAYERADNHIGDAADVEIASRWRASSGQLVALLLAAGGQNANGCPDAPGFICTAACRCHNVADEKDREDRAGYFVHDFWTHAPGWVKVKAEKAAARQAAGRTLSELRSAAGRAGRAKQLSGGQKVARLPESPGQTTGKNAQRDGTGRDGTGEDPPISPASGGSDFALQAPAKPAKQTRAEKRASIVATHRETAARVLDVFNAERERLRLGGPMRATDGNVAEIVSRLRDGATFDECRHVIRAAAAEVDAGGDPQWFNPATLFRRNTWAMRLAKPAPPEVQYDPEAERRAHEADVLRAQQQLAEMGV